MSTATPHELSLVTKRNNASQQMGLVKHRYERLDTALLDATQDPLERSLLPEDIIEEARERGATTAAELALWRLRDSLDPTHNAKFWNLVVSRLPKVVEHRSVSVSLKDMSMEDLLALAAGSSVPVEEGGTD